MKAMIGVILGLGVTSILGVPAIAQTTHVCGDSSWAAEGEALIFMNDEIGGAQHCLCDENKPMDSLLFRVVTNCSALPSAPFRDHRFGAFAEVWKCGGETEPCWDPCGSTGQYGCTRDGERWEIYDEEDLGDGKSCFYLQPCE